MIVIETPAGNLLIEENEGKLTRCAWTTEAATPWQQSECANQLAEYFAGTRKAFDLPLDLRGTDFQLRVWAELQKIPYGQTRTYGQIAAAIGKPGAQRAVAQACSHNPLCIIIPCHRVVASTGLGGYTAPRSLTTKRLLLALEGVRLQPYTRDFHPLDYAHVGRTKKAMP